MDQRTRFCDSFNFCNDDMQAHRLALSKGTSASGSGRGVAFPARLLLSRPASIAYVRSCFSAPNGSIKEAS